MNIESFKSLYEGKCTVTLEDPATGSFICVNQLPGCVQVVATLRCNAAWLPLAPEERTVAHVLHDECTEWSTIAACPIVAAVLQTL
jgi:hypothetical protein